MQRTIMSKPQSAHVIWRNLLKDAEGHPSQRMTIPGDVLHLAHAMMGKATPKESLIALVKTFVPIHANHMETQARYREQIALQKAEEENLR